jgi:hypothetical protein
MCNTREADPLLVKKKKIASFASFDDKSQQRNAWKALKRLKPNAGQN